MYLVRLSLAALMIFVYCGYSIAEPNQLTLKEALVLALKKNRNIKIEEINYEGSKGDITKEYGTFDPQLTLLSSYTEAEIPTASTFIEGGTINEDTFDFNAGIEGRLPTGTFYQLIDFTATKTTTDSPIEILSPNWFDTVNFGIGQDLLRDFGLSVNLTGVINAKRTSEISRNELIRTLNDTFLEVEIQYWELVASIQNLELQKTALELAKDLERRNTIEVEVGVLPPVSITQAKSEVASREVDVISAENEVEAFADRLKNTLVIPLEEDIVPADTPNEEYVSFIESEVTKQALKNRPEIERAKLNMENNESLRHYYSNQRLPHLSVQANLSYQGLGGDENPNRLIFGDPSNPTDIPDQFIGLDNAFDQLFNGDFMTWSVLGVFSFPIFNWEARGQYVKAKADYNRSIVEYDKQIDDVNLDVRNSLRAAENSKRAIDAAKVSVELAKQVVNNDQERLDVGIGTTRDVLESQRDLVDAQSSLIRAIALYNIALARVERARGTIIQSKGIVIE